MREFQLEMERAGLLPDRGSQPSGRLTLFDGPVFSAFVRAGEVVEVRIPHAYGKSPAWGDDYSKGTVSGYFDNHKAFCNAVKQADRTKHAGIYFTLQVIDPRLLGRALNRLKPSDQTTSDPNVLAYRWLPIDLDPLRPSGVSSSERELEKALELRDTVADWMQEELKFPPPVRAVSGNGGHLLFRLPDLPASEENRQFLKGTLESLADQFDTQEVTIDKSVFNPARIWKLYGTTARKGDEVPVGPGRDARPHRVAYIEDIGGEK